MVSLSPDPLPLTPLPGTLLLGGTVGIGVEVGEDVGVAAGVVPGVGVEGMVGVAVSSGVALTVGVAVGEINVTVGEGASVSVGVGVAISVAMGKGVSVIEGVSVDTEVAPAPAHATATNPTKKMISTRNSLNSLTPQWRCTNNALRGRNNGGFDYSEGFRCPGIAVPLDLLTKAHSSEDWRHTRSCLPHRQDCGSGSVNCFHYGEWVHTHEECAKDHHRQHNYYQRRCPKTLHAPISCIGDRSRMSLR